MTTTEAPPLGHVDVVSSTCWYLFIFDFFIWFSILFINILWRGGPSSFRCSRRCSPSGRQRPVVCREMNGFQSATRPAPDPRQTRTRPAPNQPHTTVFCFVLFIFRTPMQSTSRQSRNLPPVSHFYFHFEVNWDSSAIFIASFRLRDVTEKRVTPPPSAIFCR